MFARIFKRTLFTSNRLVNLSAGAAPLPLPVLQKAQKTFLQCSLRCLRESGSDIRLSRESGIDVSSIAHCKYSMCTSQFK